MSSKRYREEKGYDNGIVYVYWRVWERSDTNGSMEGRQFVERIHRQEEGRQMHGTKVICVTNASPPISMIGWELSHIWVAEDALQGPKTLG